MNIPPGTMAVYRDGHVRFVMPDELPRWREMGYYQLGEAAAQTPTDVEDILRRARRDLRPVRTEELISACEALGIDPPNKSTKAELLRLLLESR